MHALNASGGRVSQAAGTAGAKIRHKTPCAATPLPFSSTFLSACYTSKCFLRKTNGFCFCDCHPQCTAALLHSCPLSCDWGQVGHEATAIPQKFSNQETKAREVKMQVLLCAYGEINDNSIELLIMTGTCKVSPSSRKTMVFICTAKHKEQCLVFYFFQNFNQYVFSSWGRSHHHYVMIDFSNKDFFFNFPVDNLY